MEQLELKTVINACQMDELSPADQHLMSLAIEATQRSYAPYSHFHVGAAVRLDNGVEVIGIHADTDESVRLSRILNLRSVEGSTLSPVEPLDAPFRLLDLSGSSQAERDYRSEANFTE